MTSIYRNLCRALMLIVAALASPARAGDAVAPMTLALAPFSGQVFAPPAAEPVLLCGNRWVNGDYVLSGNCKKACTKLGHPAIVCQVTLVALCQSCWKQLQGCAAKPTPPEWGSSAWPAVRNMRSA